MMIAKIDDKKIESEIQKSFGFVNNTFINIYSDENPILNIDDECYFLFCSDENPHRTIIGKGIIKNQIINDGINIIYYIALNDIYESDVIKNNFVYGKRFQLNKININSHKIKNIILNEKTTIEYLNMFLFKIEGFFVRNTLESIKKLQYEYTEVIIEDLKKQLNETQQILDSYDNK